RITRDDRRRVVCRAVVHDQDLVSRPGLSQRAVDCLGQIPGLIVSGNGNGDGGHAPTRTSRVYSGWVTEQGLCHYPNALCFLNAISRQNWAAEGAVKFSVVGQCQILCERP